MIVKGDVMMKRKMRLLLLSGCLSGILVQPVYAQSICQMDGIVDSVWLEEVEQELQDIPEGLLDEFQNQGWSMYVTDKDIDTVFFDGMYGSVMGVTLYEDRQIYIEDRETAVRESTQHEFGHFLDYISGTSGFLSDETWFQELYWAESAAFCDEYQVTFYWDSREFFAEGFFQYFEDPERLREAAGGLYDVLDQLIQEYA